MKIPSLFGRAPKHQRFSYTPRYYDPKKEEKLEREGRIRNELEKQRSGNTDGANVDDPGDVYAGYRSRMKGSFQQARKRSKSLEGNVMLIRLGALLFVALLLFAFLQWGKVVFYSLVLVFPAWIWLRFIRRN
jgi:hypothetical protein